MWPCTVCMDIPLQPIAGYHMSYFSACVLSLLTKPICQIMTWNRAISVNEGTFSPFPFHTTAYISPWENRLTQWDHYCLFTSLFCIWRAGKPVVVTHKQMHTMQGLLACDPHVRGFDFVFAGLEFYLLRHMIYPPLLTSYNARPWKRSKWKRCFAFICNTLQSNLSEATHKIHLPSS